MGAVALVVVGARAARRPSSVPRAHVGWAVLAVAAGAVIAFGALEVALLANDFSIEYVAEHHARSTPFVFKIATAWAALEGSIVLWVVALAVYTALVFRQFRRGKEDSADGDGDRLGAGALAVMGLVAVFFFGLLATYANPFHVVAHAPSDGPGPNPLLQNHILMAIHPPLLYFGYVGFTAPFAFAISALALGRRGPQWVLRTRRWALLAWVFLTAGITCGALWSYAVLGWGGYWAWDPVENASLLPWLVGTAYLHSSLVQARRGMLQAWSTALVISTFALTILGTFLTRSGVIGSVHSFTQSAIGPSLLVFLLVVVLGSFALYAARAHLVTSSPPLESLASREGAFLLNNLLLSVFAFTVLSGTLYPIVVEALSGDQLSVGAPFFDRMAVPLALALLLAMGLGPLVPYRAARPGLVWERARGPLNAGLTVGAVSVLLGLRAPYVILVVVLGAAIVAAVVRQLFSAASRDAASRETTVRRAAWDVVRRDAGFWGGQVSHVGVVLVAVGIAASASLAHRSTITLDRGETAHFSSFTLRFDESYRREEPNYTVRGVRVDVRRGSSHRTMAPELRQFPNQVQAIGTPSVWTTPRGDDVYLSIAAVGDDSVTLRLYRYPFVFLIWVGGVVTAGGGVLAALLRKRGRVRDTGVRTRDVEHA